MDNFRVLVSKNPACCGHYVQSVASVLMQVTSLEVRREVQVIVPNVPQLQRLIESVVKFQKIRPTEERAK